MGWGLEYHCSLKKSCSKYSPVFCWWIRDNPTLPERNNTREKSRLIYGWLLRNDRVLGSSNSHILGESYDGKLQIVYQRLYPSGHSSLRVRRHTKCKTYYTNCLEYPAIHKAESYGGVSLEYLWNVGSLDKDRRNNDEHANQGEPGSTRKFVNVAI